eukprot:1091814-Amphidinium_carterae.1
MEQVVHNLLKSKSCLLVDLRSEDMVWCTAMHTNMTLFCIDWDRSAGLIDGAVNVPVPAARTHVCSKHIVPSSYRHCRHSHYRCNQQQQQQPATETVCRAS